jgi:maleate cis-trans isomerase
MSADKSSPDPALSAACDALGKIMHALNSRRLLAKGCRNAVIRARMEADDLTDEALLTMAGDAFEAAALELGKRGDPNVTVFSCNPTE